jgi:hypothetical protein
MLMAHGPDSAISSLKTVYIAGYQPNNQQYNPQQSG